MISSSHLVLVPSYNSGSLLLPTVEGILKHWRPVWVVIDGSDDDSDRSLDELCNQHPQALRIIKISQNQGKGAAVLLGANAAQAAGFTHILTMDADLQHCPESIAEFMQASMQQPQALILGKPLFDTSAPQLRVQGRRISNSFAHLETLGAGIGDSLFGMRVYPLADLIHVMQQSHWARRFDFEPEIAVRLAWRGLPLVNIRTPVRYLDHSQNGISQFRYVRDNLLLTWMHLRLLSIFIVNLAPILMRKLSRPHP